MSDISNQLIKDSYNYVLQSDLSTGVVYRIGGNIPINPIFQSGLTINSGFTYTNGTEQNGYALLTDGTGYAYWGPVSASTPSSGVTSITVGSGLSANSSTGAVTIVFTGSTGISGDYLPLSGGTVTGGTIFTNGLTANTISSTTYFNLPVSGITAGTGIGVSDSNGNYTISYTGSTGASGAYLPLSGGTVTGGTIFTSGVTANTLNNINYILFNTTATTTHTEGQIHWNDDTKTLEIDTDKTGVTYETGQNTLVRVTNKTGAPLVTGTVVYIDGAQAGRPTVTKATYEQDATSARSLGFITQTINNNNQGYVTTNGLLRNVNTNSYTAGTQLYLYTGGTITNVRPVAPQHEVRLGYVVTQDVSAGVIYVYIQNGYEFTELHDVQISGQTNNDIPYWNSALGVWKNTNSPIFTSLTSTTISATTYQNLPNDIRTTGATYSNNTFTFTNNTGGTYSVLFNTVTGLTVNGNLNVTGTTTSTTISAATYQNLPYSGTVIGFGTTNYASKWTAIDSIGDSTIYDDGTFVGVGYTSPYVANSRFGASSIESGTIQIIGTNASIGITDTDLTTWGSGGGEIAIGINGPLSISTGNDNIAIGNGSLPLNTRGSDNISIGKSALHNNDTAGDNIAIGTLALYNNNGYNQIAIGKNSLYNHTDSSGKRNISIGEESLYENITGGFNVAIGYKAGYTTNNSYNLFVGYGAGQGLAGFPLNEQNTIIGNFAGYSLKGSNRNVFIGYEAGYSEVGSDRLYISNSQTNTLIYGEFDNNFVQINGNLTVTTSISATTYQNLPVSAVTNGLGISTLTTNGVAAITNTDRGSVQNIFKNIQVAGVTQFSAGSNSSNLNFSGVNITITSAATNTLVFSAGTGGGGGTVTSVALSAGTSGTDVNISNSAVTTSGTITLNIPSASATARGLITTSTQTIAGDKTINGALTTTGDTTAFSLVSTQSVGDEGGEIRLAKPATNTNLSGTSVTIDIFQNKLRFFETGSPNRGAFIDLSAATSSVGSNLLLAAGGSDYYTIVCNMGGTSFADSTIYYIGQGGYLASTSPNTRNVYIPFTSVLTNVTISTGAANVASTENSTVAFRLNNTTDTTISNVIKFSGGNAQSNGTALAYNITGLSVSVNAGDFFELKITTPAWVTNPTTASLTAHLFFRR